MTLTRAYLKRAASILLTAIAVSCGLSSCNSAIYDDEGDCEATYRVQFRYDLNMKWADAFSQEVSSVHLYAFDSNGLLVWHNAEKGEALAAEGYTMVLDVAPGSYSLLAWCGLDNDAADGESFAVPEVKVGSTHIEELQNRMHREYSGEQAVSRKKLYPLFHGLTNVILPDLSFEGGTYTCTVPLTKDTNHVRVILQHLSGLPVDPADFIFRIEEENGFMAYDNSLLSDEPISYYAHDTRSGTAGLGFDDYPELAKGGRSEAESEAPEARAITSVSVAIADLTIPRLVTGRKTFLTVGTTDGETSARIPLADYALLLKDGYQREMTDQEFLDRQDEWSLTFFLDENKKWIATSIMINSWKIVFNNVDFGNKK